MSTYATKEELDKVKGMIDVSARIVGSDIFYIGAYTTDKEVASSLAVTVDYDYAELVLIPFSLKITSQTNSNPVINDIMSGFYSVKLVNGGKCEVVIKTTPTSGSDSISHVVAKSTGSTITTSFCPGGSNYCSATYTVIFYKYDS